MDFDELRENEERENEERYGYEKIIESQDEDEEDEKIIENDYDNEKKPTLYKVYPITQYQLANKNFIENKFEEYEIEELEEQLQNDKGYHLRIHADENHILFGDIDHADTNFKTEIKKLCEFMNKYYKLKMDPDEFSYTYNIGKKNSFHFSNNKIYCTTTKQKEIFNNYNKTISKNFDTSNYSEHWFRLPNQKKERKINTEHKIKKGYMKDFITNFIPDECKNIENIKFINPDEVKKDEINKRKNIKEVKKTIKKTTEEKFKNGKLLEQINLLKKFFDECYKPERFNEYNNWINIGMAIKNHFGDSKMDLNLYDYISKKSSKYNKTDVEKYYKSFNKDPEKCNLTIKTLFYYAKTDNKEKYIELMRKANYWNAISFTHSDIADYIKELIGENYIWLGGGDEYILYSFNGKYWETGNLNMMRYISTDLYEFLKNTLFDLYDGKESGDKLKKLEHLKTVNFKKFVIESTKENLLKNNIKFDMKSHLLGFNNLVLDLHEKKFREYTKEDYISITTGYDWREPTKEELKTVNKILNQVFPIDEERKLLLQIYSTCLLGECLQKFIIFNGKGRNGKGVLDDLLLSALGNYGILANSSLLFEKNKTGANPEKARLDKKRCVIFREPAATGYIDNSILKEMTGGGKLPCRGLYDSNTEKYLFNTTILECNKRPKLKENPTTAEMARIIDIRFNSIFTTDEEECDAVQHIYKANNYYSTEEFKEKYKYALIKIILDAYKQYEKQHFNFILPESVKKNTTEYLEMSCQILEWMNDIYDKTNNKADVIELKILFDEFKNSDYYFHLSKSDQRKYNYHYFINYFEENHPKYYRKEMRTDNKHYGNIILGWKLKPELEKNKKDEEKKFFAY